MPELTKSLFLMSGREMIMGIIESGILGAYISCLLRMNTFLYVFYSRYDCMDSHSFYSGSRKGLA